MNLSASAGRGRRGPGRPRGMDTIRRRIVRMAPENREWGDTRIRGARGHLGHQVARGTLANVRKERGLKRFSSSCSGWGNRSVERRGWHGIGTQDWRDSPSHGPRVRHVDSAAHGS